MDRIRSQAIVYKNLPFISPQYRSVVHLEDNDDKTFWDGLLQQYRPGKYFYVTYSKSKKGKPTTGCDQCLKFRPYLDSRFFICIDSDLRHLMGEPNLDAKHYVIQTYTYSFENHYCEINTLQDSVNTNAKGSSFNFSAFLQSLSTALYEPLLLLLYCKRTGKSNLDEYTFRKILKAQCTGPEIQNNGQGYVDNIINQFKPYLKGAATVGFDSAQESTLYKAKGLDSDNAYLHVRGHNVYNLIVYIGKRSCSGLRLCFETDVLTKSNLGGTYWEYTEMAKDIKSI